MNRYLLYVLIFSAIFLISCDSELQKKPTGVEFHKETLKRIGNRGDNWCITWISNGDQITSMCDGRWLNEDRRFHNHLYRIIGEPETFTREDVPGYPLFTRELEGWFGYGVISIDDKLYSMVSKTPGPDWSGPFRGIKMLKSTDNGNKWYRVNSEGEEKFIEPNDNILRDEVSKNEMFFLEESGRSAHGQKAYPFSFCSFVQQGKAHGGASDNFVYIYSPEGSQPNELILARVNKNEIEFRDRWEYFKTWDGEKPVWSNHLEDRGLVHEFPTKNDSSEYFGWYSWLPSVVWNKGLGLYIMVNGGTYAGYGLTDADTVSDFYHSWMHTKTGSLGFWYSKNPYGPWEKFYYTDYWTVDNENNRTYQPKLSPKWISDDGKKMVLIWSDAMKNAEGKSHSINYLWNQMEISIKLD